VERPKHNSGPQLSLWRPIWGLNGPLEARLARLGPLQAVSACEPAGPCALNEPVWRKGCQGFGSAGLSQGACAPSWKAKHGSHGAAVTEAAAATVVQARCLPLWLLRSCPEPGPA
jgi:hypothetical protein